MGLILVTGATGLVGNNVVRQLIARGDRARVLVRQQSESRPLADLDVERFHGDVRDVESLRRACEGVDAVIHSAAYVCIGRTQLDVHRAINVEGTRNVARVAGETGLRMVHVSTCDAIGTGSPENPATEDTPITRQIPCSYVISKREAEKIVLDNSTLNAVIVNPAFMLGPWDWKPSSGRMLLEVTRGRTRFAPRGTLNLCDVRDVAAATISALEKGQQGRRYILAGETLSFLTLWRRIAELCGGTRPLFRPGPLMLLAAGKCGDFYGRWTGKEPDVNSGAIAVARAPKHYSSERARNELGYQTRPTDETIQDAWKWFVEYGYS
jgi:dihydroflavonol-4-reductase